jgi:hypothetical protein
VTLNKKSNVFTDCLERKKKKKKKRKKHRTTEIKKECIRKPARMLRVLYLLESSVNSTSVEVNLYLPIPKLTTYIITMRCDIMHGHGKKLISR